MVTSVALSSPAPVAKPFLVHVQEKVTWAWKTVVWTCKTAGAQVGFLFWRAMEWWSPLLALRAENMWLRLVSICRTTSQPQPSSADSPQLRLLQQSANDLRTECNQLQSEKRSLEQQNLGLIQRVAALELQQQNITQHEATVVEGRDLLVADNRQLAQQRDQLRTENAALIQARNQATQQRDAAQATHQQLQQNNQHLEQRIAHLMQQLASKQTQATLHQKLANIDQLAATVKNRPNNARTGLDLQVDQLVPVYIAHLRQVQTDLLAASAGLASSMQGRLQDVNQTLDEVIEGLQQVPQAFRLHQHWTHPMLYTSQEAQV